MLNLILIDRDGRLKFKEIEEDQVMAFYDEPTPEDAQGRVGPNVVYHLIGLNRGAEIVIAQERNR